MAKSYARHHGPAVSPKLRGDQTPWGSACCKALLWRHFLSSLLAAPQVSTVVLHWLSVWQVPGGRLWRACPGCHRFLRWLPCCRAYFHYYYSDLSDFTRTIILVSRMGHASKTGARRKIVCLFGSFQWISTHPSLSPKPNPDPAPTQTLRLTQGRVGTSPETWAGPTLPTLR